jgi:hypothetical protein
VVLRALGWPRRETQPADVTLTSAIGANYGPITVTGMGTTYTIKMAKPIDRADRVTLSIDIPGALAFSGQLRVLPGDINGGGVVNSNDLSMAHKEWHSSHAATFLYGDVTGDGAVIKSDYSLVKRFIGKTLPKLPNSKSTASKAEISLSLRHRLPAERHR